MLNKLAMMLGGSLMNSTFGGNEDEENLGYNPTNKNSLSSTSNLSLPISTIDTLRLSTKPNKNKSSIKAVKQTISNKMLANQIAPEEKELNLAQKIGNVLNMLGQSGMKMGALSDQFIEGEGGEPARSYLQRESGQQYKESMAEMNRLNNLMKLMKLQQEGGYQNRRLGLQEQAFKMKANEAAKRIQDKYGAYDKTLWKSAVELAKKNKDINLENGIWEDDETTDPTAIYEYLYSNQYKGAPSGVSNVTQQADDWESFRK